VPDTFKHDDDTVQVPTALPPQAVTLSQEAGDEVPPAPVAVPAVPLELPAVELLLPPAPLPLPALELLEPAAELLGV
jgi:hypothetical protein